MCRRKKTADEVCAQAENSAPEGASCSGAGRILNQDCMNALGDVIMAPSSKMEEIAAAYKVVYDECAAFTDEVRDRNNPIHQRRVVPVQFENLLQYQGAFFL